MRARRPQRTVRIGTGRTRRLQPIGHTAYEHVGHTAYEHVGDDGTTTTTATTATAPAVTPTPATTTVLMPDGTVMSTTAPTSNGNGGPTTFWGAVRLGVIALAAYHGYRRNDSIGWAVAWAFLAGIAPPVVIGVAFAQGLGDRKGASS